MSLSQKVNALLGEYIVRDGNKSYPLKKSPSIFKTDWLNIEELRELITLCVGKQTGPWVIGYMKKDKPIYIIMGDYMEPKDTKDKGEAEILHTVEQIEVLYSYLLIYSGWKGLFIEPLIR